MTGRESKEKRICVFSLICGIVAVISFAGFLMLMTPTISHGYNELMKLQRALPRNIMLYLWLASVAFSLAGVILSFVERRRKESVSPLWYVCLFECSLIFVISVVGWLLLEYAVQSDAGKTMIVVILLAALAVSGAIVYFAAKWLSAKPKPAEKEPE